MSYGRLSMSKVKQITRGSIAATSRHNMREDVEHWSTEHVDSERSEFNVLLIGHNTKDDICEDIAGCDMRHNSKKNPKDDVIAAEFILAPSKEWLAHLLNVPEFACTPESCVQLEENHEFLKWLIETTEALKRERCISAILHMDETTPHIHAVCSVKMKRESSAKTEKSKRRSKKSEFVLSFTNYYGTRGENFCLANARGEKREKLEKKYGRKYDSLSTPLGQLQTRLWEKIGKPFGMDRGEAASETGIKGKSVKQWRIEQAKAKIDKEVAEELTKYSEEKKSEVTLKKHEIDKESQNEVSSFELEAKNKVEEQKATITRASEDEIAAFGESEKSRIKKECEEISSQAYASISSFELEMNNAIIAQKNFIKNQSKKILADYEEQKKNEEEEERKRIIRDREKTMENLQKEEFEFNESADYLSKEYKKQRELANKLATIQREENAKIENVINNLNEQIKEKSKAIAEIISRYITQLEKFSNALGYAIEKIGALTHLTLFRNKILADSRFKTGRQILATRRAAEKRLDNAIEIGKDAEKISNIIDNFKP